MDRRKRPLVVARLALTALGLSASARAQPTTPTVSPDPARVPRVNALFAQGNEAFRRGDYPAALEAYRAAWDLDPLPDARFNMARAYEALGDVGHALAAFEDCERLYTREADRAEVRTRLENLRRRPVPVVVVTEPSGATVRVDEADEGPRAPTVLQLPPGPHVLSARQEGYRETVRRLILRPGETPTVTLTLEPLAPGVSPPPPPPPAVPAPGEGLAERIAARRTRRFVNWRLSWFTGVALPQDALRVGLGGELGLFLGRHFTTQLHALWISDPSGNPLVLTAEVGWTFRADELDIGLLAHAGVLFNCVEACRTGRVTRESQQPLGGLTLKADLLVHPRFAVGLYGRFSWRSLDLTASESVLSSLGLCLSFEF